MNGLVGFGLCTLSDKELIEAVDKATDELFEAQKIPKRHIPAKPNEDYDLLVGELIQRFNALLHIGDDVLNAFEHEIDTILVDKKQDKALNALKTFLYPDEAQE